MFKKIGNFINNLGTGLGVVGVMIGYISVVMTGTFAFFKFFTWVVGKVFDYILLDK